MAITKDERRYLDQLGTGRMSAKKSRDIYGICDREIRHLTASLRKKGVPICSGQEGYWIASTEEEKQETVRVLFAKADEIARVAEGMQKGLIGKL